MLWAGRLVFICQAQAPGLLGPGMPARSQDSLMMATALLHAAVPLKRVVQPEIPAAGPEYGHLGKNYVCGLSMDVLVCECDVSYGDMSSASHTAGQILLRVPQEGKIAWPATSGYHHMSDLPTHLNGSFKTDAVLWAGAAAAADTGPGRAGLPVWPL